MLMEKTKNQMINEEIMQHKQRNNNSDIRIAIIETSMSHIFQSLERIEKRFDSLDKRFDSIDKKFEGIDRKFEAVDRKFENMDKKIDAVNNRIWTVFLWTLGAIGAFPIITKFALKFLGV